MQRRNSKGLNGMLVGLLLVGAIAACDSDHHSISGPQAIQYTLSTIDGHQLPHQVAQSGDGTVTTVVDDMILTIVEDRTWHSVGHETVTTNGVPATEVFRNGGSYATGSIPGPDETAFRDAAGDLVWIGSVTETDVSLAGADSVRWVFQR